MAAREFADGRFAAHARHHQVHEHGVEDFFVDGAQRFLGRGRLPNYRVGGRLAQQCREAVAEQGMVVDDEQFHARHLKEWRAHRAIAPRVVCHSAHSS